MTEARSGSRPWVRRERPGREAIRRPRSREGSVRSVVAVGLTGGIGAGKSTALTLFQELGAVTISADEVVHGLYVQPEVKGKLAAHFGPAVLDVHGEVDRKRLAEALRGRGRELRWLEELTHPRVAEEIERRINEATAGTVLVCEVPLLFESRSEGLFDLIVTVEAGRENRRLRSIHRFDLGMFSELEELQASSEQRVAGSDAAFVNDGDAEQLRAFVREAYGRALGLVAEGR
jgi:dephospho-CoA kinase